MTQDSWKHVTDCTFTRCTFKEFDVVEYEVKGWTERLRVPGGWLYRVTMVDEQGPPNVSLCFVPAP